MLASSHPGQRPERQHHGDLASMELERMRKGVLLAIETGLAALVG